MSELEKDHFTGVETETQAGERTHPRASRGPGSGSLRLRNASLPDLTCGLATWPKEETYSEASLPAS